MVRGKRDENAGLCFVIDVSIGAMNSAVWVESRTIIYSMGEKDEKAVGLMFSLGTACQHE